MALNLSAYHLTYADNFNTLSIANTGTATANWYSRQAWGGGFGSATFMAAGGGWSPFLIVQQGGETALQIEMHRNPLGQLESGLISTTFPDGSSAMPTDGNPYGYYETRLWLPEGQGIWPALWAIEEERLSPARDHVHEIDVLEHYGAAMPDRYTTVIHNWNWAGTKLEGHASQYTHNVVGNGVLSTGWHTYGVEVTPTIMTFDMDGDDYWTVSTPATLTTDLIFIIDLAAGGGWPIDPALNHVKMYVDYFRVYQPNAAPPITTPNPPAAVTQIGTASNDVLTGSEHADVLEGLAGNDTLVGKGERDVLRGGAGNDFLDGGAGVDHMEGGSGNDVFYLDNSNDVIVESPGAGYDTVRTTVSVALPPDLEKVVLYGVETLDATGNASNNYLYGNVGGTSLSGLDGNDLLFGGAGNDRLDGGAGDDKLFGQLDKDVLYGGSGKDTFVFDTVLSATLNVDRIADFSVIDDVIHLDNSVFTKLVTTATLSDAAFHVGTAAHDVDDRIIYNSTTGALSYDPDGNGPGMAIGFAELSPGLTMTYSDFIVI
jgi:Ca2+-binding RTX toxin-like protein